MSLGIRDKSYRIALLLGVVIVVPLGYWVRFSKGLSAPLLQDIGGSIAYQVMLMFLTAVLFPGASPAKLALGVFLFSSGIEFLQLCKASVLVAARATWVGRVILGTTFLWADFPPYALGCVIGWLALRILRKRFPAGPAPLPGP